MQAFIDLAQKNESDKFVFEVSWKDMNKTPQSGKYVLVLKDTLLTACSV